MKVLFVATETQEYTNALAMVKALGRTKDVVVDVLPLKERAGKTTMPMRILNKLGFPADVLGINDALVDLAQKGHIEYDAILFVKPNLIKKKTITALKNRFADAALISWSLDDMYAKHNRSNYYVSTLPLFDLVVTTKSYNVAELKSLGAQEVLYVHQAYAKDWHTPQEFDTAFAHDVLFIGSYEADRFEVLMKLAKSGIKVNIYGAYNGSHGWKQVEAAHENLIIHPKELVGKEYATAISSSKISLCFLRKKNRDLHTSRSIEIPACGGFMLAERTDEHLGLFMEGVEAEYFSNEAEMIEKVTYYLANDEIRAKIAQAGLNRCLQEDYSYGDMARKILNTARKAK